MPESTREIECLVFDLDDTLYPERDYVLPRLAAVAEFLDSRFGPRLDYLTEMVRAYEERLPGRHIDMVLARAGIGPEAGLVAELVKLYRSGTACIAPYPDVCPLLARWQPQVAMALVTDGYPPTQRKKVESLRIKHYFREVIYTGELGPGLAKPSAEAFRLIRERLGFGGAAVYVGDNPALDVPGPRSLGWTTVRIRRPGARFASQEPPRDAQPDFDIRALSELETVPALTRLFSQDARAG